MSASDRAGQLTAELLDAVEAYDPQAVAKTLKRILPSYARTVMVGLAVVALVNIKQRHGENWREYVIPSLETFDKEAR